jgi:hypothetical protein
MAKHAWKGAALCTVLAGVPAMAQERGNGDIEALQRDIEVLQRQVRETNEWRRAESLVHLAGYGAATYVEPDAGSGAFTEALFAPIFHYQYRDLMMLEAELEVETSTEGETETALEYLALDLFLNDYVALVAGKFLSPIGQFRQNLHPSWINKLPSAPPGFGHDGAAPVSDVGAQLRGGAPLGARARVNYALYVANGPEVHAEGGEVEGIEAEGRARDVEGSKVVGGRIGFLPTGSLEIGLSAAAGEAAVTEADGAELSGDPARDYDVAGADFAWRMAGFEWRGEYVRSEIGAAPASVAPEGAEWTAWYAQISRRFLPSNWEAVLRYTDFDSPHADLDQKQTAFGINYLFAAHVIAKLAFESNEGEAGTEADNDRVLLQIAYGF